MKAVDYCLAGWSRFMVALNGQTTIAFANFWKESRGTIRPVL